MPSVSSSSLLSIVGGSEPFRSNWEMYLPRGLLLIFVVDSADHQRLPEAKRYLHQLIEANPILPLVVFANKQVRAVQIEVMLFIQKMSALHS